MLDDVPEVSRVVDGLNCQQNHSAQETKNGYNADRSAHDARFYHSRTKKPPVRGGSLSGLRPLPRRTNHQSSKAHRPRQRPWLASLEASLGRGQSCSGRHEGQRPLPCLAWLCRRGYVSPFGITTASPGTRFSTPQFPAFFSSSRCLATDCSWVNPAKSPRSRRVRKSVLSPGNTSLAGTSAGRFSGV